ncbi:MAG: hypothetical protein Q9212_007509 [Teloschistes hypoglaucus]
MSMSELRRQPHAIHLHHRILQIPKTYLKNATFVQIFEHLVMNLASEHFPARTIHFTRACMEIIVVYCLTKKDASTAWLQSKEFRPYRLLHEAAELLFHPRTRTVEGESMVEFFKDRKRFDEEQEKRRRIVEDLD